MALEAAEELQKEGRSVRVVNARFIKPIDENMMKEYPERRLADFNDRRSCA
jgi:transketolase C-terminal domain/subunit